MREVFPVKYYKDEGFVERKIERPGGDHQEDLRDHAEFEFDEIELVNNRPMNIWLHAKCRTYIDPDDPDDEKIEDADVQVSGPYHEDDESPKG